jgi:16S rRNA (cytosine1402-N4)-methyltransferase
MQNVHTPVLIQNILQIIESEFETSKLNVFDGTLGGGGYSQEFLTLGHTLVGSDLDNGVVVNLNKKFENHNFTALQGNFSQVITTLSDNSQDVIVVDLGYSSNQLESSYRGFSYMKLEEEFDLRYDNLSGKPAYEMIKNLSEHELRNMLFRHSGESISHRISKELSIAKPATVADVVKAVEKAIPAALYTKKNAILSRVWQAFRIEVNEEFEHLELFLNRSLHKLKQNGLLMVVDFHSLEDKIVTNFMRQQSKPVSEDSYGNRKFEYELLTKKPIEPSEKEVEENIRSRSARLRVLKKL